MPLARTAHIASDAQPSVIRQSSSTDASTYGATSARTEVTSSTIQPGSFSIFTVLRIPPRRASAHDRLESGESGRPAWRRMRQPSVRPTKSITASYQARMFRGFWIQWFSSGNTTSSLGTPWACRPSKSASASVIGTR